MNEQKRTKVEYISIYLRQLNMDYRDIVVYSMTCEWVRLSKRNVKYVVRKVKTTRAAATAEQHFYGCTCYNVSKGLTQNAFSMRRRRQHRRTRRQSQSVHAILCRLFQSETTVANGNSNNSRSAAMTSNEEDSPTPPEFVVISILQLN